MLKFLRNLYSVVCSDSDPSIMWNESGDGFVILDKAEFMSNTFPKLCKSNEYGTFVRQLNNYGFSKEKRHGFDEFTNPKFLKGSPHLLDLLKRKTILPSERMNDISIVKDNQMMLHSNMTAINEVNRKLSKEVYILKKRVDQQDRTINELVRAFIRIFNKQEAKEETLRLKDNTDIDNLLSDIPHMPPEEPENISIDEFLNNEFDQV
ncbi:heat shock transcription factor 1 [Nematocida ausubeli]|nr:heat shock transcription factor 1 [Nematocida ausubeli]